MSEFPFKAGDKLIDNDSGFIMCTVNDVDPWNQRGIVILDFYNEENAKRWSNKLAGQITPIQKMNLSGLIKLYHDGEFQVEKQSDSDVKPHVDEEIEEMTPGEEIIEESTNQSQTYKDFVKELSKIDTTSANEIENDIRQLASEVDPKSMAHAIELAKKCFNEIVKKSKVESNPLNEDKNTSGKIIKKSVKDMISEIFPTLSFYPALGVWGIMDKVIRSDKGFSSLSTEDSRLLATYMAVFFGLLGSKIAYNRLKEYFSPEKVDKEIQEALRLAGIQLDETVESNLDDAKAFVSNELQSKFGSTLPENGEEKDYIDDLINMATMKFNVPEDSLRNALGLVEEEPAEEPKEPSEEVPGEEIETI